MIENQLKHKHLIRLGYKFVEEECVYEKETLTQIIYCDLNRFFHRENGPAIISKIQNEEEYWHHGQFFLSKKAFEQFKKLKVFL